jgi:hypothetical protein
MVKTNITARGLTYSSKSCLRLMSPHNEYFEDKQGLAFLTSTDFQTPSIKVQHFTAICSVVSVDDTPTATHVSTDQVLA